MNVSVRIPFARLTNAFESRTISKCTLPWVWLQQTRKKVWQVWPEGRSKSTRKVRIKLYPMNAA